jgi:hypothetical protein
MSIRPRGFGAKLALLAGAIAGVFGGGGKAPLVPNASKGVTVPSRPQTRLPQESFRVVLPSRKRRGIFSEAFFAGGKDRWDPTRNRDVARCDAICTSEMHNELHHYAGTARRRTALDAGFRLKLTALDILHAWHLRRANRLTEASHA